MARKRGRKKLCPIGYDLFCFYGWVDKGISLFDVMFGYTSSFTREILFRVLPFFGIFGFQPFSPFLKRFPSIDWILFLADNFHNDL